MNIVLDTNVLISATLWQQSVAQKLLAKIVESGIHTIFSSSEILAEYRRVLVRDFSFPEEKVSSYIENVLLFVALVNPQVRVNIVEEDPDDNKIIECALESQADFILSYDKHLLDLKETNGVKILRPEEALSLI